MFLLMGVVNIGVFGRRNAGKSSIANVLLGQDVAIVSETPGTTTDPVRKRVEISGIGPCCIIDTAGTDDSGSLGKKRVEKTMDTIKETDAALLVFTGNDFGMEEQRLMEAFTEYAVPVLLVHNKSDIEPLSSELYDFLYNKYGLKALCLSCASPDGRKAALNVLSDALLAMNLQAGYAETGMFESIVKSGDRVLLICPIDSEAPTGRLILPQVMAIRSLLDAGAVAVVSRPESLGTMNLGNFDLAVTDSQVFRLASEKVPEEVPLTSFSMLLARSKGCFRYYLDGTPMIDALKDGDRVLILESCTHHASCEDIGRVKLPALFRKYTGKRLEFDVVAGLDRVGRPVREYALVAQCGGCMITGRQLYSRLLPAISAGVPVTNYGMAISYMNGIYARAIKPLV